MGSPSSYQPRFVPQFNQVYQATECTFVTVRYEGGGADPVAMLVGDQNPPNLSLGLLEYEHGNASWVVRPGEFWVLRCKRDDGGGFRAIATPM